MNNSFKELPSGYKLIKSYSLKDFNIQVKINLLALFLFLTPCINLFLLKLNTLTIHENQKDYLIALLIALLIFFIGFIFILSFHELIQGYFYKKYTNEKPKLVINLQELSLKVEDVYIIKKEIKIILISPLLILPILFLVPILILPLSLINISLILMFSFSLAITCYDIVNLIEISKLSKDGLYFSKDNIIYLYDAY